MRGALAAATILDWTALARVLVEWGLAGSFEPGAPFFVPLESEWAGVNVAALLARHGVGTWGFTYANGECQFWVKREQAYWAARVMAANNVPLLREG